jgi:predicted MFS family arabinose efflux permease
MAEPAAAVAATLPDVKATHLGIVAGLAMGPAVALGLGRFAYALLLPAMRADLGWNYAQAGAINTANAAGYLAGALAATPIAARLGEKRSFVLGLVLTAAALMATGATTDFLVISVLRALAGAAGALSFVTGGALASAAGGGGKGRPALALGVYFGGAGFGMMVSAFVVPALIAGSGWQVGWLALGMLSLLGVVAALPAVARTHAVMTHATHRNRAAPGARSAKGLVPVLISYVMFGAGYIAYTTFIVAYLRRSLDYTATDITLFWGLVGGVATGAGIAWGPVLSRLRGGRAVAAADAVVASGAILPVVWQTRSAAFVSAVLFGGSFLIVPTSVTAFARRATPPHTWTASIAVLTVGFAIGQCVGPLLSGAVSDSSHGLGGGLLLSGGILAAAAVVVLFQREPE